jgi:hypothetical protein
VIYQKCTLKTYKQYKPIRRLAVERKEYRIRLMLSKRWIRKDEDVVRVTYLIYAPDLMSALNFAYKLADAEFQDFMVIDTQVDPLYN